MKYRPEIDGLRALAVGPVILFHAGLEGLPGGFFGVDVFFVISGYLITAIILDERREGRFSLVNFYERRARRILPALFLVTAVSIPLALFIMVPSELLDFSKGIVAVSLFSSNVLLWFQSGYFNIENELRPLFHTWSLGVEEQFYILYALALLFALRLDRRTLVPLLAGLTVAGFLVASWVTQREPIASFYLLPTRAWELLAGAVIAFANWDVEHRIPRAARELLALLGIAAIVFAVTTYEDALHPGWYTLLPVVGSALVILFAGSRTLAGKLLAAPVLVALGLVSYSAYLWHQPLFAFARVFSDPDPIMLAALSSLSVGLAALSYRFVERPLRNRTKLSGRTIWIAAAAGTLALATVGYLGVATNGFEALYLARHSVEVQQAYDVLRRHTGGTLTDDMAQGDCGFWAATADADFVDRFARCASQGRQAVLVLGDSHAMNVYSALLRDNEGAFVVGLIEPGCRPWNKSEKCPYLSLDGFLAAHGQDIDAIVLNYAGAHLLTDELGRHDHPDIYQGAPFRIDHRLIEYSIGYLEALAKTTRVVWLGPWVEARVDYRDVPRLARSGFSLNRAAESVFAALDDAIKAAVAAQPRIFTYRSFGQLFGTDWSLLIGECLTYRDQDHLSVCGETLVGPSLRAALAEGS